MKPQILNKSLLVEINIADLKKIIFNTVNTRHSFENMNRAIGYRPRGRAFASQAGGHVFELRSRQTKDVTIGTGSANVQH